MRDIARRIGLFSGDFLPESWPQLLFPLASYLIFIGSDTQWLPFRPEQHNFAQLDLLGSLAHASGAFTRYVLTLRVMHLVLLGSIVLWCMPVRHVIRKFVVWVYIPAGIAILDFLVLVFSGPSESVSLLEPKPGILLDRIVINFSRLSALGIGFYAAVIGLALLALCLRKVKQGKITLPVRFWSHSTKSHEVESSLAGRIFMLVGAVWIFGLLMDVAESPIAKQFGSLKTLAQIGFFSWGFVLLDAIVCAAVAVLLLDPPERQPIPRKEHSSLAILISAALGLGIVVVSLPRVVVNMFSGVPMFPIESGFGSQLPYLIGRFEVPPPLVWTLVAFSVAWLHEFVLRGRVQAEFTRRYGLKRAIFLVTLLAWMLPMTYAIMPLTALPFWWPVVRGLLFFAIYGSLSAVAGWFYARTNSILPGTAFFGALMFLHLGRNFTLYVVKPWLYGIEFPLVALAAWLLFRYNSPIETRIAISPPPPAVTSTSAS
jgi:hypothetical protein